MTDMVSVSRGGSRRKHAAVAIVAVLVFFYVSMAAGSIDVIGSFEPNDTPSTLTAFGFTGGAGGKVLAGGATDPDFGVVPAAQQGGHVYGLSWADPGVDGTVEVYCQFSAPYDIAGKDLLLLDVYAPAGTTTTIGLGIWFGGTSTWVPEGAAVGVNGQWTTLAVHLAGLGGTGQTELNFGFKRVEGAGVLFVDNLRLVSGSQVVFGSFEPDDTPTTITPFGFTGGAGGAILPGAIVDPQFGAVPAARQATHVYGLSWGDPGVDSTVEVNCCFSTPFSITGNDALLLDVYAVPGTDLAAGLGIWFANAGIWVPETTAVGVTGQWVSMVVPLSGASGTNQDELNLGFKRITGGGQLFVDNLRMLDTATSRVDGWEAY